MLLEGMKVVSFCHYLQGPAAMQYLADMGANVIKIEPPRGAFERHWAGANNAKVGGVSAFFLSANRNVQSLAVDLKHPSAKEVIFRLIDQCHVVAENYRPSTLERLGFGYEAVKQRKADIIYASASGFGASGPYAARPGQDLIIQAMAGLATAGGHGGVPLPIGCAAVDQHGASLFALAIAGAYAKWLKRAEGTRIEATLLGAAVDLQAELIVTYRASGVGPAAFKRSAKLATWFHAAPYGIYAAKDCYLALSLNEIEPLATALDSSAVRSFVGNNAYVERDAIAEAVAYEIAKWTFDDLVEKFDPLKIWYARVDDYDNLVENPQARHNGSFQDAPVYNAVATLVSHPIQYDGVTPPLRHLALAAGADTRGILSEARFSTEEIDTLIHDKVIFAPEARQ